MSRVREPEGWPAEYRAVEGGLAVTFPESAMSWDGVHGGLVVGALVDAAAAATGRAPATLTAHLHRPVEPGTSTIAVSAPAAGRSATSAVAVLEQERRRATATVLLTGPAGADLIFWPGARRDLARLPRPDEVPPLEGMAEVVPFARYLDIRPLGSSRPLAGGDSPALTAWVRLRPSPAYRPAVAALLLDALAPSLYAVLRAPVAIPTIEFTVHLTPVEPAGTWFLVDQRTVWSTESFCIDEAELRDADGSLLASSRQLRRVLG